MQDNTLMCLIFQIHVSAANKYSNKPHKSWRNLVYAHSRRSDEDDWHKPNE